MKKLILLLLLISNFVFSQTTIFSENIGSTAVTGTTAISANTFQNTNLSFVGTADVRTTTPSTYVGASAGNNVFITNTIGKYIEISNIDTSNYTSITLSLGLYKSTTASNGSELVIETSSDGTTYTPLTFTKPTGAGTATWTIINPTGTISSCYNLRIRFRQTSTTTQFRIDDIVLKGNLLCSTSTTWNGTTWSNGTPTSSTLVIIDGTYDTSLNGNIDCCSLVINTSRTLTITNSNYVNIQNNININGTLNLLDSGNLIINSSTCLNKGNISYTRTLNNLNGYDYVYWSTPVANQTIETIYTTPSMGYKYYWDTLANNTNSPNSYGNWSTATGTMNIGQGYIVRSSSSYGWNGSLTTTITGVSNSGTINTPIQRGTLTSILDDNWNLIGNPYPSSINAITFLNTNTTLDGYVCVWKHINAPTLITSPFYGTFQYNYSNDYVTYNSLGSVSGSGTFSGYIASGQGFFVSMLDTSTTPGVATFNNSMRSNNNSLFYKEGNNLDRIWIDLIDSSNNSKRTLIGYTEFSTNGRDRMYDAKCNKDTGLYSLINNESYTIQGRQSFDDNDQVPLGINITTPGEYI